MRVALVYDRVNKWGGAERILLALHELFPEASLFTSVYDQKGALWAKRFSIRTSFLQKVSLARRSHELFGVLMPIVFEQFSFDSYDLVISVTSEAAKGIIVKPQTKHICYCLTPTRYLWSGYEDYFSTSLFRLIASPAVSYLKRWEEVAISRPDIFVAISNEVKRRIKKYYHIDAQIIYPPLDSNENKNILPVKERGYFLVVSRLVAYKRIDLAVKACNERKLPLKIIGTGSELGRLRAIAGPSITFLGSLTDEEVVSYYKGCRALLFPGKEDFGLTVLEAQQYGKPVIAYKAGGAIETVLEGKTGLFFYPQTIKALEKAIRRFERRRFRKEECQLQAARFSKALFKEQFLNLVDSIV